MCTSRRPARLGSIRSSASSLCSTEKQIKRGVYRSIEQLEKGIRAFIDAHNDDPKPFRWTKSADDILAAIQRFCLRTRLNGGTTESGR